ncbi:MAG: ABC transporter permease [Acidobacteria bacterium]|nr:ABC transporter permease [Acidobacteriota bacterium]
MELIRFFLERRGEVLSLSLEHLVLVVASTLMAALIAVPLGIVATRRARLGRWILGLANVVQTIPSLALIGFLIPLPILGGIGARTAMVVLVFYALLPIVRNTYTGITGVDPAIRQAALGMGLTDRQLLMRVELPLALPVIFAGLRVATVVSVGVATIAAYIGAGGLGSLIFRGINMLDNRLILAGAIPAALMALGADWGLGRVQRRLTPAGLRTERGSS